MANKQRVIRKRTRKRGRKTLIEQYINRHTKELKESILLIEPKLIKAFVIVYGEEHRDFITHTIKNMEYIFFISENYGDFLLKIPENQSKKSIRIIKSYLAYLKKLNNIFKTVKIDEEEYIIKNYLPYFPFSTDFYSVFKEAIEGDNPCCSAYTYGNNNECFANFYICLPLFTIDLKTLIHEINHSLNIAILGYTDELLMMRNLFSKEAPEELTNDFIASIVFDIYKEIGGIIPRPLRRIKIGNEYEYKDYAIAHLFEKLYQIILESRISGNFNLFNRLVGEIEKEKLEQMIEELFEKDYFDEALYNKLNTFIDELANKINNTHIPTNEELLDNIEKRGIRIRRLKEGKEI